MPRYAANLSMLWPELDMYDKFAAAAEAGFKRVEILFVHALDHDRVERLLAKHDLSWCCSIRAPATGRRASAACFPCRGAKRSSWTAFARRSRPRSDSARIG